MARPLRIEYPGAYYHVTSRGNERKAIFREDQDRRKFLKLLETPEGEPNRALRYLNGVYTQNFNRRHRRLGT